MAFTCPHCQREIADAQLPELRTFVRHEGQVKGVQLAAVVQLLSLIAGLGFFFYISQTVMGSFNGSMKAYQPIEAATLEPGRMEKVADGIVVFTAIRNPDKRSFSNPQFQINFFDKERKFIDQCQVTSMTKVGVGETQNLKLKCVTTTAGPTPGYVLPTLESGTIERADSFELKFLQAAPDYLALAEEAAQF